MQYHHVGIPTDEPREGEHYIPHLKMYVVSFDSNPFGIEWIRFDPDADFPEVVKRIPHVAFVVDDLDRMLVDREVIIPPTSPSAGVRVAFILENGAPVEFLEYEASS